MLKHWQIITIIALSLLTHFIFFGHPNETVFDEVHFGKFISGYFTHEYFFDIHPPLGKLLISGMGYLSDFKPGFSFANIGESFPDRQYLWLRLLPTFAGALLPIIIFFLALRLGLSKTASFAAGMFIVFENSILAESRFILLDSFLLLFGFGSLLAYFTYREKQKTTYLILSGVLAALSLSVKWTGATFLALIIVLEIIHNRRNIRHLLKDAVFLLATPFIIYFLIFAIHLELLTKSGPGDAFMSLGFQKTLAGNNLYAPDYKPLGLTAKFVELNLKMYGANATLKATHPYSSQWYEWPFMIKPIYYWYQAPPKAVLSPGEGKIDYESSRVYLIGNPVTWWLSTIALLYMLYELIIGIKNRELKNKSLKMIILGGFLLNLLPFIGISRVMFLYHYMTALVFAILALAYVIDRTGPFDGLRAGHRNKIFGVLIALSAAAFIFFAPLTYGLPMTDLAYNLRIWHPAWR